RSRGRSRYRRDMSRGPQLFSVRLSRVLQCWLQQQNGNAAQEDERSHDDPKNRPALLPLFFLKRVTTMAAVSRRALLGLLVDEIVKSRQDLLGVEIDESGVRGDKAANER